MCVKTEAEIWVMGIQAKEHQGHQKPEGARNAIIDQMFVSVPAPPQFIC